MSTLSLSSIFTKDKTMTIVLLTMSLFYFSSCEYQNKEDLFPPPEGPMMEDPCMPESVSFAEKVLPIIELNCNTSGCHNSQDKAGGVDLGNYEGVFQSIEVTQRFSGAINHDSGFSPMPLGGAKLPACDISVIEIWIANGSNDN